MADELIQDNATDKVEVTPEVESNTIDLSTIEPADGVGTFSLQATEDNPTTEYVLDGTVGIKLQENKLDSTELALGQAISEASSFEEVFSIFDNLGGAVQSGYSPNFDYARESNKELQLEAFSTLQPSPLVNNDTVNELQDDILMEDTKSDIQLFLEETAMNLNALDATQESKDILSKLAVEMTPLAYNRAISELLLAKQSEAWESTTVGQKIDEGVLQLVDAFGVQERAQQVNTLDKLTGKNVEHSFYRSEHFAQAIEDNWDNLSFQEQFTMLSKQIETTDAIEKGFGYRSSLVGTAVWSDLNTALTEGSLGHDDWVSWFEAASAVPALGWLVKSPSRLKAFIKASAVKNNSYHNYLKGLTSEEAIQRDMEAVKEFQKMFNPDNATDNVETIITEKAVSKSVERPLADLERKVDDGITRGERKALEASKKQLVFKKAKVKERDVNKEARELSRTTKTKFKDAKKRIQEQKNSDLADIESQQKALQVKIDKADEAFKSKQQLSREINKGTPLVRESFETKTIVRVQSGKLMDVTSKFSPNILKSVMQSTDDMPTLESVAESMGYTLDDVVTASMNKVPSDTTEGINPTLVVKDSEVTANDLVPDNQMISPALLEKRNIKDLLTQEEQMSTVSSVFQNAMALASRFGTLRLDHTTLVDTGENTVTAIAKLGKNETEGYDSYEIAKLAMDNVPEANKSVVVKHTGSSKFSNVNSDLGIQGVEYFVEVRKDITFDASDASMFSDTTTKYKSNWINELFFEPVDKMDRNIVKAVSYLRNIDNSLVKKLDKILSPFTGANKNTRLEASELLVHGDLIQKDLTLDMASAKLNRVVKEDDKTWLAYGAVNRYYKEVGEIRNWRERVRLDKDGFKKSNLVDSEGKEIFTRLMPDNEINMAIKNGETKVWDAVKQVEVDLEQALANNNLNGVAVMKTNTIINRDGNSYTMVLDAIDDLKPLPQQVIPLRQGHVDMFYEDVGAVIKVSLPSRINGKLEPKGASSALKLANTEEEALKWLDTKVEGSELTNREVLAKEAKVDPEDIGVSLSREAKMEAGVHNSTWNGNVKPYNLRSRGDSPMESISGDTQVMSLEDRLVKSHNALSTRFGRDGIDIIKNRWLKTYGEYLENPTTIPDTLETGLVKDMGAEVRNNASNVLRYIHTQERVLGLRKSSEEVRAIDSALDAIMSLPRKIPVVGDKLPRPVTGVANLARWVAIYGNPVYQTLVNTIGIALSIIQRDPVKGSASAFQTLITTHGLGLRKLGYKIGSETHAKMAGFKSTQEYDDFIDGVLDGGIFSANQLDNILAGTSSTKLSMSNNRVTGLTKSFLKSPKGIVTWSTDMGHLVAYRHAVKLVDEMGLNPYKGKGRIEADKIWQDLTQRMNKSSTLSTESNEYSKIVALFTQHVMKGFKDTVLQPTVKVATGKNISKNPSLWADSYQQAVVSTAMNIALFGLGGMVGKNTLDALGVTEEVPEVFVEGALDLAVAEMVGEDVDLASRIAFGDAIGMFTSLTGLDQNSLNLLGAGDMALTKIGKFMNSVKTIYNTPVTQESDLVDLGKFMAHEGSSIFSGYNHAYKARMVKSFGLYFTTSGVPSLQVDPDSWTAIAMSMTPDNVQEFGSVLYDDELSEKSTDFYLKELPNFFIRFAYFKMINEEQLSSEGLTFDKFQEILEQTIRLADGATAQLGADNLRARVKRTIVDKVWFPRDVAIDSMMANKLGDAMERVISMHGYNKAKDKLQFFIETSDNEKVVEQATFKLQELNNQKEVYRNGN